MQPEPVHGQTTEQTWRDIFTNPDHNGQTWACVAVAIVHADDMLRHATRNPTAPPEAALRRGGPLWTHTAVSSYQLLTRSGAYRHKALDLPGRFVADEPAIHTWLHAPDPRSPAGTRTVADLLEVDSDFLLDDGARPGRLARLVDEAQSAGVLRCPRMRVEVWHMADDEGDLIGHRIAVHRDGAILASEQLNATDLIDESRTGIDAALAVLTEAATVATRLVATAAGGPVPAEPVARGYDQLYLATPQPGWAQGFRTGIRHPTANPPAAPQPPDLTTPGDPAARGPHR